MSQRRPPTFHGLLVVDKPGLPQAWNPSAQGPKTDLPTSHDVVQLVRRWSQQRRIGHTGTLDPMASGVLVLCLGQATRLVEYYQGHDKRYIAEVSLGEATDTYDALGKIVDEKPVPTLSPDQLEAALGHFRGEIWQTPPIYSAVKQGGESVHRKARRGEEVKLKARQITIHELSLVDWNGTNRLHLRVRCSAGTYIRSLAHDLGVMLGTGGHLSMLRREAAGPFTLADAYTLAAIESGATEGRLNELLLAPGHGLSMPRMVVDDELSRRFGFGQKVALPTTTVPDCWPDMLAQAHDGEGRFLGILRVLPPTETTAGKHGGGADGKMIVWKAEKWFSPQS